MKIFFTFLLVLFANTFYGQTFTNTTGGAIPDASTAFTCFPVTVSGVGIINGTNGLKSVCLNIAHTYDGDLKIKLQAPDGTWITLSDLNGSSGDNYTNTCFSMNATNPVSTSAAPFTGNFIPDGNIGWFNNNINADGVWSICVQDIFSGEVGSLSNWSLTFGANPAPYPGVGCNGNLVASPFCQYASGICNLSGYCGNTSANYGPGYTWPELRATFCGSIENNSFIQFVASAATATFNVNVSNSQLGFGIQFMVFSGGCGSGPVTSYGCINQMLPGLNTFNATGLTPGNTYYLMIDGNSGDVCDFNITAGGGVNVLSVTPAAPTTCVGGAGVALTASGGNGTYTWSPAANLSATTGATVTATPANSTTYTVTSGAVGSLNCPLSSTVTVTVSPRPTVTAPPSVCVGNTITLSPTTGGTWLSNNTAVATVTNAGVVTGVSAGNATFTFTNTTTGCNNTTTSVTVVGNVTPTFAVINPFCIGTVAPLLPTTSTNGITGTWSPATISNILSGTYIFTPTVGVCASTVNVSVTVNPLTTPTFTAIAPICSGSTAPVLPTTSTNGITGTWNPAIVSNTVSGTYLFTPTVGLCASTANLSVVVNPIITPLFNPIAAICSGATAPILPTTSTNGIAGSWNPATVSNTASGTYTFTPANGLCASATNLSVSVIPNITPTFAAVPAFCSGAIAPVLPTTSSNGIAGTWNPALVNNITSAVYTFTPNAGQCATTATLSITVTPLVTPTFTVIAPFCNGATAPTLSTTSINGITGTWSPALVSNTISGIYTFTPNAGQCATILPVSILVLPKPIINLGVDRNICENTTTFLDATNINPLATYLWQNGSTNPTFTVVQGGTYAVTVNDGLCTASKTVVITIDSLPKFSIIGKKDICPGEIFALNVVSNQTNNSYLWQNGSINTAISINTTGNYFVDATNFCGTERKNFTVSAGICRLFIPNAFTPNGDNKNDTFKPGGGNTVTDFTMEIYNKWGQKVFATTDVNKGWDGLFENKESLQGAYVYHVTYKNIFNGRDIALSGTLLLIR
jgi:gliding motility-associated-like protein